MNRMLFSAAATSLLMMLATPARAAIELEPGQWQDTETGDEDGKPVKPEVTSDCMTPEDVKQSGNTVSIVMMCGDPKEMQIDMTGSYTFIDRKHYTGTMKTTIIIAGKTSTANKSVDSKWIGACKQ